MDQFPGEHFERAFPPRLLSDIVGHEQAVKTIIRRIKTGSHGTPLLLYGPDGVGKRTVARMYAKILFCEAAGDGATLPCGRCAHCKSFDQGILGLMEFEAQLVKDVREFRRQLDDSALAQRRVLIIERADTGSPEFMDALLKPMEEGRPLITFILLTSDLNGVRKAGQSRSTIHRLRRLTDIEMRALCLRALHHFGIRCEDEVALKKLAECCQGLPGRLQSACHKMGPGSLANRQAIERVMDAAWVDAALRYWSAILGNDEPDDDLLALRDDANGRMQVERTRSILSDMMKYAALSPHKVEDVSSYVGRIGALLELLSVHSQRRGIPELTILAALAKLFLCEDYNDAVGYSFLGRQARRIVSEPR